MFLTMVFFASGVCENGCTIEKAGILSIVSGFTYLLTAALAYKSAPMDSSSPKSKCCCCPMPIVPDETSYKAIHVMEGKMEAEESPEEKALIGVEDEEEAPPENAQGDDGDQ